MKMIPLFDLCEPKQWPTVAVKNFDETGFPVYGANGVIGHYSQYTHTEPTVLVGCRGSIGTIHVTDGKAYANGNAMALDKLKTEICAVEYLAWYLRFRGFDDIVSGSSQPQITQQNLRRVMVPVPEMDIQVSISHKLGRIANLLKKTNELNGVLDALLSSSMNQIFSPSENSGN